MVRQKPGPKNALGLINFVFANADNIYLHSTPSQALFGESRRDFSHDCIRVEDPKALATWVLRNNPGWTRERVDAAFESQKQEQVNLAHEIPVLILYGTAIAKQDEPTKCERIFFRCAHQFSKYDSSRSGMSQARSSNAQIKGQDPQILALPGVRSLARVRIPTCRMQSMRGLLIGSPGLLLSPSQ
jgi:L,D-transpeptidase-like protein